MNNYLFPLFIFAYTSIFAYEDLGKYGTTFEIKEESLMSIIERRYADINKTKIVDDLKKSYKDSFIVKSNIPTCKKSKKRIYVPELTLTQDIVIPYTNEKLFSKGYKYNILKENNMFFGKYILFVDASDDLQVRLAQQLSNQAFILVVKGDLGKLLDLGVNAQVAREKMESKSFDLQCTPSLYTQQDNQFLINEYNLEDLK